MKIGVIVEMSFLNDVYLKLGDIKKKLKELNPAGKIYSWCYLGERDGENYIHKFLLSCKDDASFLKKAVWETLGELKMYLVEYETSQNVSFPWKELI